MTLASIIAVPIALVLSGRDASCNVLAPTRPIRAIRASLPTLAIKVFSDGATFYCEVGARQTRGSIGNVFALTCPAARNTIFAGVVGIPRQDAWAWPTRGTIGEVFLSTCPVSARNAIFSRVVGILRQDGARQTRGSIGNVVTFTCPAARNTIFTGVEGVPRQDGTWKT